MIGDEFSFDSVFIAGEMVWHSINHYMPSPLTVLEHPWIQWCVVLPRDISGPEFDPIRQAGVDALRALGMHTGLSHMEWFRRADGSVAVSEVGARPPGAQFSTLMSFAHDVDMYTAWARLMVYDTFDPPERKWAVGAAYLRPQGRGRIRAVHGIDRLDPALQDLVVMARLPQAGAADVGELRGRRLRDRPPPRDGCRRAGARAVDHDPADRVGVAAMDVLMISPGYPAEMPMFTAALAAEGANVIGVGDQPVSSLPDAARHALSRYVQISSFADEERAVGEVLDGLRGAQHRPRRVDVGGDDVPRRPTPRAHRRTRPRRRRHDPVPRQGVDEGGPASGGDPGAALGAGVDDRRRCTPAPRRSATR